MVARYFTPQHGFKGWSERGGTSGVAPITKGRGQGPCSITIEARLCLLTSTLLHWSYNENQIV